MGDSVYEKRAEIFIVDDVPANLNLLCQTLKFRGYRVVAVPSGGTLFRLWWGATRSDSIAYHKSFSHSSHLMASSFFVSMSEILSGLLGRL